MTTPNTLPLIFGSTKVLAGGESEAIQIGEDVIIPSEMALTRREFFNGTSGTNAAILFYIQHTPKGGSAEKTYTLVPALTNNTEKGSVTDSINTFQAGTLSVWVKYDPALPPITAGLVGCNLKLELLG